MDQNKSSSQLLHTTDYNKIKLHQLYQLSDRDKQIMLQMIQQRGNATQRLLVTKWFQVVLWLAHLLYMPEWLVLNPDQAPYVWCKNLALNIGDCVFLVSRMITLMSAPTH